MKLWEILKEHNWSLDARMQLLKNLNELDFKNKEDLAKYAAKHKIRPTTAVNVAGKKTTAGDELPDLKDDFDEEDYIYDGKSNNSEGISESVGLQTKDEFSDNELKLKALKYGFGTHKDEDGNIIFKAAPGNKTSLFNEIISGEVTSIIQENPNMTDDEIAAELEKRYGDLKGFKDGKSKLKISIAAGRNKHKQMNDGVDLLNEQGKIGKDVKMRSFYGHSESLAKMVKLVEESKGPFYTREGVEIPKDELIELIKASGGGDNPSDTAMIGIDSEGRGIVAFHSDKDDMAAIQANSTTRKQIDNAIKEVEKMDLPEEEKKQVIKELEETKNNIIKSENKLKGVVVEPANELSKKLSEDPDKFIQNIKDDANLDRFGPDADKAGQPKTPVSGKLKHITGNPANKKEFLNDKYLPEGVTEETASEAQKVQAFLDWVGDPERIKENERRIEAGEDPIEPSAEQMKFLQRVSRQNGIPLDKEIGKIKEEIIKTQHDSFDKLNERTAPDGTPLGVHLEYQNFVKQFHLGEEGVHKYPGLFSISAGETMVDRKKLKHCIGDIGKENFKKSFSVSKPGKGERTTYKKGSDKTIVTGRDIFYYNSEGKKIGKQTQRSKRGPIFGLDSTFQYPPKVVKCFETGTKP
jgi:hypothetical protein